MRPLLYLTIALGLSVSLAAPADAHPGIEGTRNLSLGSASRSSSFGTNAALINPSNMSMLQTFALEPIYQFGVQGRRHGLGFVVMDSLNNPRLAVGMGYLVMRGSPSVSLTRRPQVPVQGAPTDNPLELNESLELVHIVHQTFAAVGLTVIKNWMAIGVKPKYQLSSLRYSDRMGAAHNAHTRLNAFGLDASMTISFAGWAALSGMVNNIVGHHTPPFTDERELDIGSVEPIEGTVDHGTLSELSDFPLTFEHGLSIFPLRNPNLSLNFDGVYDFSSYRYEDYNRIVLGGSAEFVVGPLPLRLGAMWDTRGRGEADDRVDLAGGLGYIKPAKLGGLGVDMSVGIRQQLTGPSRSRRPETVIGLNLGLRLRPNL